MLSIKDLHVSVEDKAILRGLSLDVRPGEVHAIMGPNGSGKSTLSATLAGREDYEVTSGTVEFKGKDLLALSPEDRAGEFVFVRKKTHFCVAMVPAGALRPGIKRECRAIRQQFPLL